MPSSGLQTSLTRFPRQRCPALSRLPCARKTFDGGILSVVGGYMFDGSLDHADQGFEIALNFPEQEIGRTLLPAI